MKILAIPFLLLLTISAQPLKLENTISLEGINGRIDHMAIDLAGKRIFLSALGNSSVEVIDLESAKIVKNIHGFRAPQGLLYWPELNRLYVANGEDGHVRSYDGGSLQMIADYDFNSDATNLRLDPAAKEVFVGYGDGALGVINADLKSRVGETILDTHPESFQLEARGPRIFVNVPNAEHVAVIDRRTRSIVAKWPISSGKSNFAMALDEANQRLFIGCRKPAKLVVLDTATGKEITRLDITGDTDDLFYDAELKRIYVSGGAGAVSVVQQADRDHYQLLATIPTSPGARTSLFVPELKRLYVAVPHRARQEAGLLVFSVTR